MANVPDFVHELICIHRAYKMNTSMFAKPVSSGFSLMPLWIEIFFEFYEATVEVNF